MNIKKLAAGVLVPVIMLTGCSGGNGGDSKQTTPPSQVTNDNNQSAAPSEIVKAVLAEVPISSSVEKGKSDLEDYYSGIATDTVEEADFALCGSGALPDEIAVIKCKSSDDAKNAESVLKKHLDKQKELFTDYTPKEMYKLEGAEIFTKGNYAVYIALSDNEKAKSIVMNKL